MFRLSMQAAGQAAIGLHGTLYSAPQRQAQWSWAGCAAAQIEEVLTLSLKGPGIETLLNQIEALLAQARCGESEVQLVLQRSETSLTLTSPLLDGWLELLGGGTHDRARGFQGAALHLTRANHWDAAAAARPLSNANGARVCTGLRVYNHCDSDAGHQNYVDLAADDLDGAQPAPAVFSLDLGETPQRRVTEVFLAAGVGFSAQPAHTLEAELGAPGAGVTSSVVADAAASNQAARQMGWTGSAARPLVSWDLDAAARAYGAGQALRPVLRLRQSLAQTTYLRWKVTNAVSGALWMQTHAVQAAAGHCLLPMPAVHLPGPLANGLAAAAVRLELWGEAPLDGAAALDLDFVHLLPAAEWTHVRSLGGTPQGSRLVLDGRTGRVFSQSAAGEQDSASHVLVGRPLRLQPGRPNRVYVLFECAGGAAEPLQSLDVQLFSGGRWQCA